MRKLFSLLGLFLVSLGIYLLAKFDLDEVESLLDWEEDEGGL